VRTPDSGSPGQESVREAFGRASEQCAQQEQALRELGRLLLSFAQQNFELHRRTLAVLEGIKRDVERFKRQLKQLSSARV